MSTFKFNIQWTHEIEVEAIDEDEAFDEGGDEEEEAFDEGDEDQAFDEDQGDEEEGFQGLILRSCLRLLSCELPV